MEAPHDDDDDADDFLREVASVEDVPPPAAEALRPRVGDRLGHFEIVAPLGRGGMGVVYLARDNRLGRNVALKLLPPTYAADAVRRERLLREARAAAALSHPNLVAIHEVDEHDGAVYLVLEYVAGETLRAILAARPLQVEEALSLARGILAGLSHAHAAGLLHRDLKPENVLVGADGRARILDFGLAKNEDEVAPDASRLTREGHVLGTPGYMSPEQARGFEADARADVFSFGATFFEMLTGARAFDGASTADVVSAVLRDDPPRVTALRKDLAEPLADIVARCLRKHPEERFASCDEVLAALACPPAPRARSRRWLFGIAAAVVAAGAITGVGVARRPRAPTTSTVDAAPAGMALTAVPPPRSSSPEALALYAQGLQAFRDADWDRAATHLLGAVQLDSSLAAAHLRLAIVLDDEDAGPAASRSAFARAMTNRANLSPRDQEIADAIEPLIDGEPGDTQATSARLGKLVASHPGDAEILHLFVLLGPWGTPEGIHAEEQAVAIDPQFADAWQTLAGQLAGTGDEPGALAALDRCVAVAPWSKDCHGERARVYSASGQCDLAEGELRRMHSSGPWLDARAAALLALGREDETVREVFRQKWELTAEPERLGIASYDNALLAVARGRFVEAVAELERGIAAIDRDVNLAPHARYTSLLVKVLHEMGREHEAASAAERYLLRRDVWVSRSLRSDATVPLVRALHRAGRISKAELGRRRDAWLARAEHARAPRTGTGTDVARKPVDLWVNAWARGVETRDEASEAVATMATYPETAGPGCGERSPTANIDLGIVFALAGRAEEAISVLEPATHRCDWLRDPIASTVGILRLGESYEAVHDAGRACSAYRQVTDRWASAPASIHRDAAAAGAARLHCASVTGDPTRSARRPPKLDALACAPRPRKHPITVAVTRSSTRSSSSTPGFPGPDPVSPAPPAPPAPPAVRLETFDDDPDDEGPNSD